MREFDAPNFRVQQSKKILSEKGFLESPNLKPGKSLPIEAVETVRSFYEHDEVRAMPGIKYCVTFTVADGSNFKKAHKHFKDKFPSMKIGFSKFAESRPKHCLQVGQSGRTHSVYGCTIHQNVNLMIENAKLNTVTNSKLQNYKQCLTKMLCNSSSVDCKRKYAYC